MWDWIEKLGELRRQGEPAVLVTLVESKGSTPRELGAKMVVLPDGTFFGTIGGGNLEAQALQDAKACFAAGHSQSVEYLLCVKTGQCCGGVAHLMMELLNDHPHVYIFGAGHVGQALARTLVGTPFAVHLIDERPQWVEARAVPPEVTRHALGWKEFVAKACWDSVKTYVAVMTFSHPMDQEIIKDLLHRPARYLGLIGSRTKWLDFQLKMGKEDVDTKLFSRVQCPIGLKIGGKAPQEVAISAAAELLRIYYEDQAKHALPHHTVRREIFTDGEPEGSRPL